MRRWFSALVGHAHSDFDVRERIIWSVEIRQIGRVQRLGKVEVFNGFGSHEIVACAHKEIAFASYD